MADKRFEGANFNRMAAETKMRISLLLLLLVCKSAVFAQQNAPVQPVAKTIGGRDVDSLAIWVAPRKADSLVLLTEKKGGSVMVFKANKEATFVRRFGEFKRPNAVVVAKAKIAGRKQDLAFITDRDGNAVYVYSVPNFEKLGVFATDVPQPMGISVYKRGRNLVAYVVAKRATGNDKVIRFKIVAENGRVSGVRETEFGKELTPNEETVYVDRKTRTVYVADENAQNIKVYDADGRLQKVIGDGAFQAQVEGIALAQCGRKQFLIATDQRDVSEFEIFDLSDAKHLGTVITTAQRTDGIALTQTKLPDFPHGLFVAQSDPDQSGGLRAEFFDLRQILTRGNAFCK